jgi:hypothetical protein
MSQLRKVATLKRALFAALLALPGRAYAEEPGAADPKAQCAAAFEAGQRFEQKGQYLEASEQLKSCANPSCGAILFRECGKLYRDLEEATPTVVFSARDMQSRSDRVDVRVALDGQPLLEQIDGRPVPMNPGSHRLVFTLEGREPVEQSIVVRAGDKFRQVPVVFEARPEPAATRPTPAPAALKPAVKSHSIPVASYVLAGVSVVALGTFAGARIVGAKDYNDLDRRCAPNCLQSDIDHVKREYLVSNVALAVSGAALAGAVVIYVAAGPSSTLQVNSEVGGATTRFTTTF